MTEQLGQLIDFAAARARNAGRVAARGDANRVWAERRQTDAIAAVRRTRTQLLRELATWPSAFDRRLRARVEEITELDRGSTGHWAGSASVFEEQVGSRALEFFQELRRLGAPGAQRFDVSPEVATRCSAEAHLAAAVDQLEAAVAVLREAQATPDRRRVGAARAKLTRAKAELLWKLFAYGRRRIDHRELDQAAEA